MNRNLPSLTVEPGLCQAIENQDKLDVGYVTFFPSTGNCENKNVDPTAIKQAD